MKRHSLYNIVLAGFGALMVIVLLIKGPPSTASPLATTSPDQSYSQLGVDPTQIRWYELRDGQTGLTIKLEREGAGNWRLTDRPQQAIDQQAAEQGAQIIASFAVRELVQFAADDNLSQYGLTVTPRYVVSFGINAYNTSSIESFTLYVGTLTPDQQEYYVVFVDETGPGPARRQGEWVYLIQTGYIDVLAEVMFNNLVGPQTS